MTPGFTVNGDPEGITVGPDGNIWFAEPGDHRVERLNPNDGTVPELTAGVTSGFSDANRSLLDITGGLDAKVWFTDGRNVARVNPDGTITEVQARSDARL